MTGKPIDKSEARSGLKPPVYKAVAKWLDNGFTLYGGDHKFVLRCPCDSHGWMSVNGTPRDADNHAKQIDRWAQKCPERPH
ncbi:hypothetical protein ACWEKT_02505 [Nocardia takedensis]